jgi:hypothetical protein
LGFVKWDEGLLDSSLWAAAVEEPRLLLVWAVLTLKARPPHGIAEIAAPAVALRVGVSLSEAERLLALLEAPDPYTRDGTEGKRIERVDGGYRILNFARYRKVRDQDARREQTRQATQRWRDKKKGLISPVSQEVSDVSPGEPKQKQKQKQKQSVGEGKRPSPTTPTPEDRAAAERYVAVFDACTKRRVKLNTEVQKKWDAARKAGYTEEELLLLPIIHAQLNAKRLEERSLEADWLLRDGTTGTHNWIGEALRRLDRLKLGPGLSRIAREFGLARALISRGAELAEEA